MNKLQAGDIVCVTGLYSPSRQDERFPAYAVVRHMHEGKFPGIDFFMGGLPPKDRFTDQPWWVSNRVITRIDNPSDEVLVALAKWRLTGERTL